MCKIIIFLNRMELELITEREAEKEHETLNSSGGLGSVELIEKVF